MNLPSVSVVIVGRNCAKILATCFAPLLDQSYPKELIEILFIDGESTDNTKTTAKNLGANVIDGGFPNNAEARRYVGVKAARNNLLAFIDTDNVIPHKYWLRDMVRPFIDYPELVGAFTKWYGYTPDTSRMDQYYALVGGNDPVVYYLGKNDRVPYLKNTLPNGTQLVADKGSFEIVSFDPDRLPTIGCNGFLLRRSVFENLSYENYEQYLHIDLHVDIIKKCQQNLYAIVKTTLLHLTGETISKNVSKRIRYMNMHYVALRKERRYHVFNAKNARDVILLMKCMLCTFTFIEPLWVSYKGWRRTGNINWFYHPVISFLLTASYGVNTINKIIRKKKKNEKAFEKISLGQS